MKRIIEICASVSGKIPRSRQYENEDPFYSIKEIIEYANEEWGLKTIDLNVRKNNKRAIKCYENCGFLIVGEGTKLNDNNQLLEFYKMRFNLHF